MLENTAGPANQIRKALGLGCEESGAGGKNSYARRLALPHEFLITFSFEG